MHNRKKVVVGVIICLGGWWGMRYTPGHKHYQSVLAGVLSLVRQADGYDKDPLYYDALAEQAHRRSYSSSFDWLGRQRAQSRRVILRRPYTWHLLKSMIRQAKRDRRREVADALQVVFDEKYQGMRFPNVFPQRGASQGG